MGRLTKSALFLLSESKRRWIKPQFPPTHGVQRVDDGQILSGIIYIIRNGLQQKNAPN
ncbi:hypothetical protein AOR02nite_25500 [Acetobacter orientalis]|uniref:Transposase n=1 Tax=Acetobacter orientalis TaxID=146474 RepID=A0A0D6NLK5_9PROT|nr:hypothetical protein Abor_034_008 [Acetobacter orientalis]GEL62708.1 hypothetical protein AOR02nite_25500 [Acetobacter orientalis]